MDKRLPRRDSYGKPLPTLAPVSRQDLVDSSANLAGRQYLSDVLECDYSHLFRRGIDATLLIRFEIKDGTMLPEIAIQEQRLHARLPGVKHR
jgi:hypothetical protein